MLTMDVNNLRTDFTQNGMVTSFPLIRQILFPLEFKSLRYNNHTVFNFNSELFQLIIAGWFGSSIINCPASSALLAPWRINPCEPLPPDSSWTASMTIDFPAPVSPVKTVKPSSNVTSKFSMIAKFLIEIALNNCRHLFQSIASNFSLNFC